MNGHQVGPIQDWLIPFLGRCSDGKRLANRVVLDIEEAELTPRLSDLIGQLVCQQRLDAILCSGCAVAREFTTMTPSNSVAPSAAPDRTTSRFIPAWAGELLASACLEIERFRRRVFPHELVYLALGLAGRPAGSSRPVNDGWLRPSAEIGLPLFISDWEKSELGDFFLEQSVCGHLKDFRVLGSSWEYQAALVAWLQHVLQEGRTDVLRVASDDKRGWVVSWEECGEHRRTHIVVSDHVSRVEQWFASAVETEKSGVG
jgi:hypothetical protein